MSQERVQGGAKEAVRTSVPRGAGLERSRHEHASTVPAEAQLLVSLQQSIGNRAVAGLVQRLGEGAAEAGPLQRRTLVAPLSQHARRSATAASAEDTADEHVELAAGGHPSPTPGEFAHPSIATRLRRVIAGAIQRTGVDVIQRMPPSDPHVFQFEDFYGRMWSRDQDNRWYRPGKGNEKIYYDDQPSAPENEEEAQKLVDSERGDPAPPKQAAQEGQVLKEIRSGLEWKTWGPLDKRVKDVYSALMEAISKKEVAVTSELHKKINDTNAYMANSSDKVAKRASEALSELEHAANTARSGALGKGTQYFLGAQGPVWAPQQGNDYQPEEGHGNLPPIDVVNVEADGYYLTADNVLHLDEIKDTPSAAAAKLKAGAQARRQIEWLKRPARGAKHLKKQVGYWIQAEGPKFGDLLSEDPLDTLKLIADNQQVRGAKFIGIGAERFSYDELRKIYDDAIRWLETNRDAYKERNMKASEAATKYFGTLGDALKTLKGSPLERISK